MKKRIICLVFVVIMVLSLASCSCFKQGPLEEKYVYNDLTEKYIKLPDYKGHKLDVHMDALQSAIDTYLMNNAAEYVVTRGDDIYVDINVYKEIRFDKDGVTESQRGEKISALSKGNYLIKDLGNSPLPYKIESDIINAKLNISDIIQRTYKYEELEDYCPEEYAGQSFYFEIKIMDKQVVEGDVVDVSFKGYRIDADGNIQKDDKGNKVKPFSESSSSRFFIGSKLAIDDFEKGLIGATVGDEVSFYATFPDDYSNADLKNQKVIFYATVKTIYTAPVYNDAFVKALFPDYGTISNFEGALKKDFIMTEMFAYVLDNTEVLNYPKAEYNEIKSTIEVSEESFEQAYGYSYDEYLKETYNMTRDEYIKFQMKTEMVYYAIAKQEGIEPTEEMLTNERASLVDYYKEYYITNNKLSSSEALSTAEQLVENLGDVYIYENVMFELVKDFLYENAAPNIIAKTYTSISEKIAKEDAGQTK